MADISFKDALKSKKIKIPKHVKVKAVATVIQIVPLIVVMLIKFPIFVARTDSTISVAAIFVAVMCAVIFKDAFKRILSSPSPLKIAIIALAFSYIATSIGSQIMILSITAVASGVAALPLNMWYGMLIAPPIKSELQAMLEVSKK